MTIVDQSAVMNVTTSRSVKKRKTVNQSALLDEQMSSQQTDLSLFSISQDNIDAGDLDQQAKDKLTSSNQNEYIHLVDIDSYPKCVSNCCLSSKNAREEASCYQDLAEFMSCQTPPTESHYDLLVSTTSSAKRTRSKRSQRADPANHYDVLMTYKSNSKAKSPANAYYNSSSLAFNLYRVVEDYEADFRDDLSVRKDDLVYLIENKTSPIEEKLTSSEWVFVRLYKRSAVAGKQTETLYENLVDQNSMVANRLQGFVPRFCLTKM
jgi:hypothetical protein